ncbi:hypothetical protein AGR5A_Cc60124 [Agrobacterium genomosp. 5 str. CFBP 6626]|nr:hypothetical protein AGR5A_Cc60124 [Agrobacterium genomosp. 5 str. CFBP 6626]
MASSWPIPFTGARRRDALVRSVPPAIVSRLTAAGRARKRIPDDRILEVPRRDVGRRRPIRQLPIRQLNVYKCELWRRLFDQQESLLAARSDPHNLMSGWPPNSHR